MKTKLFSRKKFSVCFFIVVCLALALTPVYAAWGRKLITKSISGSFWTNNSMKYSLRATAGITYDNNKITQISDLSFSSLNCQSTIYGGSCSILARQKSKSYSGGTATYVATVSRNAMGFSVDKVDYTLKYSVSDSGTPYSLDDDTLILVDVEVGEPYK